MKPKRSVIALCQVYPPDAASVGQHLADACAGLVRRGFEVTVVTANRGYDDPAVRYPVRERIEDVDVVRVPVFSRGKASLRVRVLSGLAFVAQVAARGILTPRLDGILVTTVPPFCALAALAIRAIRRVPIVYWVMDLNPDQAVALGQASPDALSVRLFNWLNRRVLRSAQRVVVLDRFMAERVKAKWPVSDKIEVIPPWPLDDHLEPGLDRENDFRRDNGLTGKFVVMHSGNHGPSHPLDTIIEAGLRLRDRDDIVFAFVGGGIGKRAIEETIARTGARNMVSLPYQPLDRIRYSLSAADIHVVAMGEEMVGIVHPCKIYGAMAAGRPILCVGPRPSHVSDLMDGAGIGWLVAHGDTDRVVQVIERAAAMSASELDQIGRSARSKVSSQLSKQVLCARFCDVVEEGLGPSAHGDPN